MVAARWPCQPPHTISQHVPSAKRRGAGLFAAAGNQATAQEALQASEFRIVNSAAARLTGLSTRELQSLTVWDISDPMTQVSFDVLWKEFLRAGRQHGNHAVRNRSGDPVEVAYCAEAHVLPGRRVSVLRKRPVA
jgi:hypothetical protein